MKKFKLILATVLVFVMAFALVACSAPVVGEWELTKVTSGDEEYDAEDLDVSMTIEVNSDGTVVMASEIYGNSMEEEGYWSFEDDTLSIYEDEDKEVTVYEFEYKDGKLIIEEAGGEWIFEKK